MTISNEYQTTFSELSAFAETSEATQAWQGDTSIVSDVAAVNEKAELLKKIRSSLSKIQMDFQAKRPVAKEILRDSQAKYDEIMGMLNNQLHQAEIERVRLETEIAELKSNFRSDLAAIQAEKIKVEVNLEKAVGNAQLFAQEVTTLKSELLKANDLVEMAIADKKGIEKKLILFQEQWDKYIAGS
jgi:hypothetical protein